MLALVLLTLASPNGQVSMTMDAAPAPRLTVKLAGRAVLEPSPLVFTLNGADVSAGAKPGRIVRGREGDCSTARLPFSGKTPHTLELRACNGGVAFRNVVPGSGSRTPGEATAFRLPSGSIVWSHDLEGHYEALHVRRRIEDFPAGQWAAPPVTYRLPEGAGYASITEAALYHYAGLALQGDGQGSLVVRLGHEHPASYPFRLRYKDDVERLKQAAPVEGTITTPWRVVMVGKDL
ncbi:MAG: glycoside hydrolase family 97 N-terminal domain-containing protein, partial [Acidobacteria bacterium]|nr:glycoside hydrolase family 97 N-terminal domain-containing protein [Acidobacteriota bacterium]